MKLLLLLVSFVFGREFNTDPNQVHFQKSVATFTDTNFDTEITKFDYILIMFYAPWCPHCQNFAPEFSKAANELLTKDPPMYLGRADCTNN